eukprot:5278623-Alexandrium_andersonii.AAC.1
MERRPGMVVRHDERLLMIEHGEAEPPSVELPKVRDLVLTVPTEALIVARSIGATEHHVWLEVLLVLGQ